MQPVLIDIGISAGIVLLTICLGRKRTRQWWVWLMAGSVCCLTSIQAYRSIVERRELTEKLETIYRTVKTPPRLPVIQVNEIAPKSDPVIQVDSPLEFDLKFQNLGDADATGVSAFAKLYLVEGVIDDPKLDAKSRNKFRVEEAAASQNPSGLVQSLLVNWHMDLPLSTRSSISETDLVNIVKGRLIVYLLARVTWNENPQGMFQCLKLNPPKTETLNRDQIGWKPC